MTTVNHPSCDHGLQKPSGPASTKSLSKLKTMLGMRSSQTPKSSPSTPVDYVHHSSAAVSTATSLNSSRSSSPAMSPKLVPTEKKSHVPHGHGHGLGAHGPAPRPSVSPSPSLVSVASASTAASATVPPSASSTSAAAAIANRLVLLEGPDGQIIGHEHHFKSARRVEKLGRMIRELIGSRQKVRNDAVSALPDFVPDQELTLMNGLVNEIEQGNLDVKHMMKAGSATAGNLQSFPAPSQSKNLLQKYGKCQEVIGKGSYGVVRVSHKYDPAKRQEVLFAVKEFKKRTQESEHDYQKRLTSEFCISSSLHHPNIIHTLDLMKDATGSCCQVMEYCAGGDLYSLILASEGGLDVVEADCFFKQIMRGVMYMHSMGVAHCDLKPENILLTQAGVAKITDFGNGECFRMAWEKEIHLSSGVCGSRPYIAPEQFRDSEFDPRPVDVWAVGIIYMAMRAGSYLWQVAIPEDDQYYSRYLQGRKQKNGYPPIESLRRSARRNVIYSILDPIPSRRITAKQVLNSEWGRSIAVCEAGNKGV